MAGLGGLMDPHCPAIIKVSITIVSFMMCLLTMWQLDVRHLAMCRLAMCRLAMCRLAMCRLAMCLLGKMSLSHLIGSWIPPSSSLRRKNAFCPMWQHGKYKMAEKYQIMKSFPAAQFSNKTWFLGRCENFPLASYLTIRRGPIITQEQFHFNPVGCTQSS